MADQSYEERLGTERVLPLIFKMALPSVAAQLVNLLYNLIDRVYIGHIPHTGTVALAGVGVTNSVIILLSAFAAIVAGGGAPLAAIALGSGDRERAEKFLGNGFVLLLIFSAVVTSATYSFMRPLLRLAGASDDTIGYAVSYLSVYLMGTLFVMISTGLNTFINAQGRADIAMYSVLIGAALNIILDPVFIFLLGMGVTGAAVATVISQGCSAFWVLHFLFSRRASLSLRRTFMKLDKKIMRDMLTLGISPFIMASTESLVGFVLNGSLEKFGDIYVSALTIMQSAMQIVSVPINGFAQGATPVISYNYGHRNAGRVRESFKIVLRVMFFFNLLAMLAMILFPGTVASMFTRDQALIAAVKKMMPVFLAGMTIFGLQRACQNTFVALGQAKISVFIALLRKAFLLIPLALILPRFWGVKGIYASEAIADATAALLCTLIFALRFPKILHSIE